MARKSRKTAPDSFGIYTEPKRKKAAAYIRLSRETEGSIERDTIGSQTALVENYICQSIELELFDTYVDDSVSGTTFSRPAFDRMLADMRAGKFQAIVVKDMSRLGRDYIEAGKLVEHVFPLYGIRLISITDGFDTKKDPGGLMMAVANLTNAMYAQDISRKINAAKDVMREKGQPIGKVAFGYKINRDDPKNPKMVIDEETAPVVRRIFSDFISGKGTTTIARELNAEGVLTDREYRFKKNGQYDRMGKYKWSACTVQQVIRNDTYTGSYAMGKVHMRMNQQRKRIFIPKDEWKTFENHHPAIVSREIFDKAQSMKQKKSEPRRHAPNVLKNKVFCGCCGGHMGIPNSGAASEVIEGLRSAAEKEQRAADTIESVGVKLAEFKNKRKLSKPMADSLVEKVTVYNENRIEVIFKFDDELAYLMEVCNED